ncbi:MAG TPA: ATP-binding domain-containing protein [Streptomyces sp.]|nr:ATP-binding domain-containing protein [Streptomyces sp.]
MGTTTRDDIIAIEQKAVDRAYDCYETQLAEMTGQSVATASASGKDSVANRIEAEERAAAYGGLGSASLVVSRVDVQGEPGGAPETWYIGRRGVRDPATGDPVVLLWTSPLAKKWAEALPSAPGDVLLRRQLRCAQRIVEDYFDEIATAVSIPQPRPAMDDAGPEVPEARPTAPATVPRDGQAPRPPVPTPGDIVRLQRRKPTQPDDFLLRELQRSRSGRMRDIVETIRRDQMALVTGSPSDILVVQGGPGTGKSAVGLHRVTWLVHNDHFKAQDVLVIGPHQRFLDYVGQVLPTLGVRNVNAVQLTRLWDGEVLGSDSPQARLVKSDERMAAVLRRRVENECRPEAIDGLVTEPSYEGDEPAFTVTAGSTTLRIPRSEILTILDEARGGDGAYRERRDRFRSLLVDRLLRELVAISPRRGRDNTIRRDLERNRRVERLIERIWPSPGAREALRSLYDSLDLLRTCADGILDEEEQAALHRPRAAAAADEPWTLDDQVCLEELRYLIAGETPRRYGHIVIDEAQDLTPMQARCLRRRCAANGSMTVLGDLAQATGPHAYTDWDRLGALLSDHGDWRVAELNTSYRVPAEIMEFVASLARTVAPALPYPQAVREAGEDAVRVVVTEPWKLLDDTIAQVTRLVGTSDGHTLRSVAVIVPDDSDWLGEISRHLDQAEGITDQEREAVSVLAAAHAKGMEYDHVLVVEPATIADRGPAGLRQLYVALTRSTQSLTVLHTSPLPEALTDTNDMEQPPNEAAPEAGTGDIPEIGTDLRVRVVGHTTGGNYKVEAIAPPTNRPLLLAVRHGSTPPTVGAELDVWVLRHDSNVSFVTVDERGRKPISPTMAKRYVGALSVLEELADGSVPDDARTRLSELKGMANRCLRLDQPDWLDVWRVLGSPDRPRLNLLRDLAVNTSRALASNAPDLSRVRADLERSGWAGALAEARQTLGQRLAATADPAVEHEETPTVPQQPEPKESDPMPTTADTAVPKAEPSAGLLHALEASTAADRKCKTHEAVRLELMAALLRADLQPTSSPIVDVSCTTKDGHFLYEILGAGLSTHADLRSGAARLLEINHTLPTPADRLYLVLSEPPAEDWAADAIHDVFGVRILWRTPGSWGGRDMETALGSDQA